jgi:hypothetical protein
VGVVVLEVLDMLTPKTPRPRVHQRRVFSGRVHAFTGVRHLELAGVHQLELARGAWRKTVDRDGAEMSAMREARAVLWANLGDQLIVSDADLDVDAVACVEVVAVDQRGMPTVMVLAGAMPTGKCHVMQGFKAKQRKAAA